MRFQIFIFIFLIISTSLVGALPLSESATCTESEADCSQADTEDNSELLSGSPQLPSDITSKGVFDLFTLKIVDVDLRKLVDQKTAATLNIASYSIGDDHKLAGTKPWGFLVGRFQDDSYGSSALDGNRNNQGGSNSREYSWGLSEVERGPDRYLSDKQKTQKEKESTSWMSKSASSVEYGAVILLSLIFWIWLRQSRAF